MAQASDHMQANLKVLAFDFDPDGTDAVDISWQDFRDYESILVMFFRTVGTSALDTFKILANSASDGSGTDVTVKTHAVGSEPDAVGDYLFLECNVEEIIQEANDAGESNVRYVSASCEFATGTDEGVVVYIMKPKRAYDALTSDLVA